MARIKFSTYDPENNGLLQERELTLQEANLFVTAGLFFEVITKRNEPDGSLTGELFLGKYDTIPAYNYKITFIEE